MDKRLQLIAHLYDEDVEELEPLGALLQDPELRREYEALGETRFRLEQGTVRHRPDPAVVDRLVARALHPAPDGMRRDRPAVRLVSLRRAWLPTLAIAASLLLLVIVGPWRTELAPATVDRVAQAPVPAEPEVAFRADPESPEGLLGDLPPAPPTTPAASESESADEPGWDTGDEVRLLSRRIATLREIPLDAWDSPAVPLEAIPSGRDGLLTPAGTVRPRY